MKKDAAVTAYVDNDKYSSIEINWLYRSWLYSHSNERSDLVIFYNPSVDVNVLPHGSGIILVPLAPIWETESLWNDYHRINSAWFLSSKEAEIVHNYYYTLRSDCDAFLTENFVHFRPRLATFSSNVYASYDPSVGQKISQLHVKYGIKQFHMNVNNNIMACSNKVTEYAKVQYAIAKRLKTEEFKDGPGEWPGWYEYVINMYSAGIAANAFFGAGYALGGIGCMSTSTDPIGSTDYHIDCFHTDYDFSKHKWHEGLYDSIDYNSINGDSIINYCIKMAGKRGDK